MVQRKPLPGGPQQPGPDSGGMGEMGGQPGQHPQGPSSIPAAFVPSQGMQPSPPIPSPMTFGQQTQSGDQSGMGGQPNPMGMGGGQPPMGGGQPGMGSGGGMPGMGGGMDIEAMLKALGGGGGQKGY